MKEFVHPTTTSHVDLEFNKFKTKHNTQYANVLENEKRREVFRQNIRFIHSVNRQHKGKNEIRHKKHKNRSIGYIY